MEGNTKCVEPLIDKASKAHDSSDAVLKRVMSGNLPEAADLGLLKKNLSFEERDAKGDWVTVNGKRRNFEEFYFRDCPSKDLAIAILLRHVHSFSVPRGGPFAVIIWRYRPEVQQDGFGLWTAYCRCTAAWPGDELVFAPTKD